MKACTRRRTEDSHKEGKARGIAQHQPTIGEGKVRCTEAWVDRITVSLEMQRETVSRHGSSQNRGRLRIRFGFF